MNLEKRIRKLENELNAHPTILAFADGTMKEIPGRGGYLLDLLLSTCGGKDTGPNRRTHLDWIRDCVQATEPGGARMIQLVQCMLAGPVMRETICHSTGDDS